MNLSVKRVLFFILLTILTPLMIPLSFMSGFHGPKEWFEFFGETLKLGDFPAYEDPALPVLEDLKARLVAGRDVKFGLNKNSMTFAWKDKAGIQQKVRLRVMSVTSEPTMEDFGRAIVQAAQDGGIPR